jgi:hypothetical protein
MRRVATRIVEEIEQDLRNAITIGHDRRYRWGDFVVEMYVHLFAFWRNNGECLLYQRMHIERGEVKPYASRF